MGSGEWGVGSGEWGVGSTEEVFSFLSLRICLQTHLGVLSFDF